MKLRPYQEECLRKISWERSANLEGNSLCILPTGAGKSIVIAELAHMYDEPILILQPTKEILEQNLNKLLRYIDRSEIGVYSASMNEKTINKFTFATIQSIYKNPQPFAHFKLVIIDEAHQVNPKNSETMYNQFLNGIGNPKVIGFTATPYRLDNLFIRVPGSRFMKTVSTIKLINRMKGGFWKRILFNVNVGDLIDQKYLSPLEYINHSVIDHKNIPVNKSLSDFDIKKYEEIMQNYKNDILESIFFAEKNSKNVLVFCTSVEQAQDLSLMVPNSACVYGETPLKERDRIIEGFKSNTIKTVFNVGVLTTGFDHPELDCIVLLRPTRSIALYYQMLGRGVRIAPGKTKCKVIDLTSTVKHLGPIESIKLIPGKESESGKYELVSATGSWHNKKLYEFVHGMKRTSQPKDVYSDKEHNFFDSY